MAKQLGFFLGLAGVALAAADSTVELNDRGMPLTPPLPHTVSVRTVRDGLPWPLPDSASTDGIMVHALHCRQIATSPLPNVSGSALQSEMTKMHQKHCGHHHEHIQAYLRATPPKMTLDVCQILLPSGSFGKTNLESLLSDSCCSPWSEDVFRLNAGEVKQVLELPEGVFNLTRPMDMTVHHRAWLASYNFGRLLVRAYERTATAVEQEWLASWHNPLNVARGAIAYDCYNSHPEIQQQYQCLFDGVTCADSAGKWDMSKVLPVVVV